MPDGEIYSNIEVDGWAPNPDNNNIPHDVVYFPMPYLIEPQNVVTTNLNLKRHKLKRYEKYITPKQIKKDTAESLETEKSCHREEIF